MAEERAQRKLAAILAADVVGYSRLMGADETGTLSALKRCLDVLIHPAVAEYRGRIVKLMGDGILAEFASVVDAVECAVSIQDGIGALNSGTETDRQIRFRIGINLGDIIIDGDDIYGDGVNVAARLEGLAEPGGICVSASAREHVRDKLELGFIDLGDQQLKNIGRPVRAYSIEASSGAGTDTGDTKLVVSPPALPDKPSIAVLPFDNMSGDPEQEYFADGMVEDIITALSQLDQLFVISRNSSFSYKNQSVDIRDVARELGVRYVLEGSVRRAGHRVRITGQLIEGMNGAHLWADRFDGQMDDIFDLQDQITERVVGAIEPTLRKAEIERPKKTRPENLDAYDLYLRALPHAYAIQPKDNSEALTLLHKAIEIDPGYAPALSCAAWCYEQRLTRERSTSESDDPKNSVSLARRAISTGSDDAHAIAAAAFVLMMVGRDYPAGLVAAERALSLNPNTATISMFAGWVFTFSGRPDDGLPCFERALRLSPADPATFITLTGISMANLLLRNIDVAIEYAIKSDAQNPEWDTNFLIFATAHTLLEQKTESRAAIARLLAFAPNATIALFRKHLPFKNPEDLELILDGLRNGGLPE